MTRLVSWTRLECNKIPQFNGVTRLSLNSLMRRSAVTTLRATFIDANFIRKHIKDPESKGVFPRGPRLMEMITSPEVLDAFGEVVSSMIQNYYLSELEGIIKDYVVGGGDGGLTRRTMLEACGLGESDFAGQDESMAPPLVPGETGVTANPILASAEVPVPTPVPMVNVWQQKSDQVMLYMLENKKDYITPETMKFCTAVPPGEHSNILDKFVSKGLWMRFTKAVGQKGPTCHRKAMKVNEGGQPKNVRADDNIIYLPKVQCHKEYATVVGLAPRQAWEEYPESYSKAGVDGLLQKQGMLKHNCDVRKSYLAKKLGALHSKRAASRTRSTPRSGSCLNASKRRMVVSRP